MNLEDNFFEVAIVGFGPVGSVLANILGKAGLSVAVLEQKQNLSDFPRAIHFDGEVMRIFQNIGLNEQVQRIARPAYDGMHFVNGSGQTLMTRQVSNDAGSQGWHNSWYFHQPDLERVLFNGVRRFNCVAIKFNCKVESIKNKKQMRQSLGGAAEGSALLFLLMDFHGNA